MNNSSRSSALQTTTWLILAFLLLPTLVVLPVSLTDTAYLGLPEQGLSLQHWQAVFTNSKWISSASQSVVIGLGATLVATISGTLCAVGCWKLSSRLGEMIRVMMLAPLIVPTIVYALGLYRFYANLKLLDSYIGVIIAHAAIGLPYVVITVGAALANFDGKLEQAARNLGATPLQALRLVILPNIKAGILSGAVFAFVTSWDELVIVLFIASRKIQTLPRTIWSGVRESLDPSIAVVAMLLITVTFIALIPTLFSGRGKNTNTA